MTVNVGRGRLELVHHRVVDRPRAGFGQERVEGAPGGLAAHGGDVHAVELPGEQPRGERAASPEATSARMASGSPARNAMRGSKPAARQARATSPCEDGAIHGLSARSARSTTRRRARRWRGGSATTIGSSIRSWRAARRARAAAPRRPGSPPRGAGARSHAGGQVVEPALLDRDAQMRIVRAGLRHRHGHDRRQGAREGADAQLAPVLRRPSASCRSASAQPLGRRRWRARADPRPRA